jgi:hypothetical protein
MNCTEAMNDLPELACGTLDGDRKKQLETHLEACGRCRAEYDTLRQVSLLLRAAPGPEIQVNVEAVYREATRRDRLRLRRCRRLAVAACAVAALLLLALALNLEVRLERRQLILHWGTPEEVPIGVVAPAPLPRDQPAADEQRWRSLNGLVQLLAADVQALDLRQEQEIARLRNELERLRQQSVLHWEAAERDAADLYTQQEQVRRKKGE